MSSVTDAKKEVEELHKRMQAIEDELPRYRSLLLDVTGLMSIAGIKEASDVRRMIALVYSLKAAYDALQLSRMAAGDPFAWAAFGLTTATATVNVMNELEMRMPEY